ncbi:MULTISPECIES: AI-2E family transporter [Glutamicibacter]|uniref:AI-2E family transporter n=1 Tax=Glutamicibacter TaxID=1742989 RepID=UPI000EF8F669|nr:MULTISPECIES: AI-2E family transporter [Glutamicibacter]QEP07387.1 AI-2E family transporter [Glutamicibacter sp. ZJUTW]UTM47126.1 AI-2E family transporter [Glutamicibacter mysorens]
MAFFRKVRLAALSKNQSQDDKPTPAEHHRVPAKDAKLEFTVTSLWTDLLGRLGIRSAQLLIVGALATFLIIGMLRLTMIVIPTLLAVIISCALWPLVVKLRKIVSPMLAAWIVFLGSLLILGGIGTGLVFSVIREWPKLVDQAVEGFNQLNEMVQGFIGTMPFNIDQSQIDSVVETITGFLTSSQFGTGALNTLSAAGSFVTGLILLLVILFFFLKDGDKIWAFAVSWTPRHYRNKWILSGDRALRTFGGYIRGTATVAAVDALGITATLLIVQVPLAIPLGVIVFLGSFVPMVGATVAGILATLIALVTNGPVIALIVLAAVILVNQLEGNFLQPVVMANALSLHALVVLMALTAGTVLAGIVGAVLAVPLVAAAWAVIKVWTGRDKSDAVAEASEDIKSEVEISEEDAAIEKLEAKEKHREQHMESPQDSA